MNNIFFSHGSKTVKMRENEDTERLFKGWTNKFCALAIVGDQHYSEIKREITIIKVALSFFNNCLND